MFFRHYTQLNLCKISDFMEYFPTDKPRYRRYDYVVSPVQSQFDSTLINKRQISISPTHFSDYILYKLTIWVFFWAANIWCRSQQQLSVRSVYFFFLCVHIHKCMSMPACAARCCQQGHWLVNKYYRSTCFDEGAADRGVNSVPRPFFKDQFTGQGGWDIIPLFSLKICKLPSDKLAFTRKREKMCPGFCGNKMCWR